MEDRSSHRIRQQSPTLTYSHAKPALLSLLRGAENEVLSKLASELADVDPRKLEDYNSGRYEVRCLLEDQRFVIHVHTKRVRLTYKGDLKCSPDGSWVATITDEEETTKE